MQSADVAIDQRSLQDVLQFADVAGPVVCLEPLHRRQRERRLRPADLAGRRREEVVGEQRQIFLPLPQRRHLHGKNAEPIVQVLTKAPGRRLGAQIPIGRRHDTDIDAPRPLLADPFKLSLLQNTEQLRLQLQRDLADLVEKQRPVLGQFGPTGPALQGPVNAPSTWPKNSPRTALSGHRGRGSP